MRLRFMLSTVGWSALLMACSSSPMDSQGIGKDMGTTGNMCYSVLVNQLTDGSQACGPQTCTGGQYCFSNTGICNPGCVDQRNCSMGQYCDTSNGTKDQNSRLIGLCRIPSAGMVIPCATPDMSTASCSDVHGVYSQTLDTANSTSGCAMAFITQQCTVLTVSGCNVTFNCFGPNPIPVTLDATNKGTFSVSMSGQTANCTVRFSPKSGSSGYSYTWECIIPGPALDCKGTGN